MTAMRALADETESPKYAHIERERRWLVDCKLRPPLDGLAYVLIEDRYIHGTRMRLRRMTDPASGACSLKLTKKYEALDPTARPIVTFYLTEAEYALLATFDSAPLVKRRYPLDICGTEWSLDVFAGPLDGLELLEIEALDAASLHSLHPPAWAVAEISNDPCYEGGTLVGRSFSTEGAWRQY